MRLIDADDLIKRKQEEYAYYDITDSEFEDLVNSQPTSFDTEKVVEQLKKAETDISSLGHYAVYADDAIKIVLKGGQQINEKSNKNNF